MVRVIVEEFVFEGKVLITEGVNVCINAFRIFLNHDECFLISRQSFKRVAPPRKPFLSDAGRDRNSESIITSRPNYFRDASCGRMCLKFHLPKTIACSDVPLSIIKVQVIIGKNVWHEEAIKCNRDILFYLRKSY
jgi:hypothetical protein